MAFWKRSFISEIPLMRRNSNVSWFDTVCNLQFVRDFPNIVQIVKCAFWTASLCLAHNLRYIYFCMSFERLKSDERYSRISHQKMTDRWLNSHMLPHISIPKIAASFSVDRLAFQLGLITFQFRTVSSLQTVFQNGVPKKKERRESTV